MLNVETVVNADTVTIVNDGENGLPAVVRACGPDDLLDFVNPSSVTLAAGLPLPALADDFDLDITACTDYTLEPDLSYIELSTEIFNDDATNGNPTLPLIVGDWLNAAGELDSWLAPSDGLGPGLLGPVETMSFMGYGDAEGVDYAYVTTPTTPLLNDDSDYFTTSGVSVILHNMGVVQALIGVPANQFKVPYLGSLTIERYLGVGDGSGDNAVALNKAINGIATGNIDGCVTVGGVAAPSARVTVGRLVGGAIDDVLAVFTTDASGCYSGPVPTVISGGVAAAKIGVPYEGGGTTPTVHAVTISNGGSVTQNIALPATGSVTVNVDDEFASGLPARVTVVGFDPSPPIQVAGPSFPGFGSSELGKFLDPDDELPFGVVRAEYTDSTGSVTFQLEPGSYRFYASRGTEYSADDAAVTVVAGANADVDLEITRVVDTAGFISSDFHVHGIASADSRVSDSNRVKQFAGEGIENGVMTDHHVHTDLASEITAQGVGAWMTNTIGEEVTTFDYGHFNNYPMTIDTSLPTGGSTDWGVGETVGEDFPSFGNYSLDPAAIFTLGTTGANTTAATTMQINHIDSHFAPLEIDTSLVPPADGLTSSQRLGFRLHPTTPANLFHHFPALEVWNGMDRGHQSEFLDDRIGIWMNHLNQGLATTAIADTDTHRFTNLRTAGARAWTASPTDAPSSVSVADVAASVDAGRVVGGQGVFVIKRLISVDNSSNVADLTFTGSTLVADPNGEFDLEITVQAPSWAQFDTIEIYANATTTPVDVLEPYLYTATPTHTLTEGDCDPSTTADGDFDITVTTDVGGVTGADLWSVTTTLRVPDDIPALPDPLTDDHWFVVVVKGTDGVCEPMFPIFPHDLATVGNTTLGNLTDGNLGESGTMALGLTNALYADADGSPGFDPPLP
jgi:hypothetical protein